jgi:hypothetical protein
MISFGAYSCSHKLAHNKKMGIVIKVMWYAHAIYCIKMQKYRMREGEEKKKICLFLT